MTTNTSPREPGVACQGWPGDCPDAASAFVEFEWRDWRAERWRTLRLCARCGEAFAPPVRSRLHRVRRRRKLP